ncbi:hypothetical protein [Microbacterium sp. NPDC090003]|uniref:hypothetical protein n=1 Tax=Microbacterium sp. NPDC090003 TaxID=3364203 RepID=UPI00380A4ECF
MSDDPSESSGEPQIPFPNATYRELAERATAAGRSYALRYFGNSPTRRLVAFDLFFPSGAGERALPLSNGRRVREMLEVPFESFRLSARYEALIDTRSGEVEVGLLGRNRARGSSRVAVWDLPGVVIDEDSSLRTGADISFYETPDGWRLVVSNGDVQLEVSTPSEMFQTAYAYPDITLKVTHSKGAQGPRADRLLADYGEDFLLELDLKYGVGLTMAKTRSARAKGIAAVSSDTEPRFPTLRYSPEASALYWYGASATGFPMLQFLAYYQVLEYFFSSFTRRAVVERLRSRLKDPRFDLRVDTDIDGLIDASRTAHAGLKNELDQLRHTLSDCIAPEAVRAFIRGDDQLSSHFVTPKSKIRGTTALRLDADDENLLRQLADRVYRVRNRIVHTKAGAEEIGLDLLLPSSSESDDLWPEIELVRFLAQSALVHGAVPR